MLHAPNSNCFRFSLSLLYSLCLHGGKTNNNVSDWLYRSWIAGSFATIRFLLLFSYFWCCAEHKSRRRLLFSWKGRFFITLTAAVAAWHRWTFFRRNWRGHYRNTPLMATTAPFFFSFSFSFSGFATVLLLLLYALNLLLNFYSMVIYHHHLVSLLNSGPQNSRRNSPDGRIFFPLFLLRSPIPRGLFGLDEKHSYTVLLCAFFFFFTHELSGWNCTVKKKRLTQEKWLLVNHISTCVYVSAYFCILKNAVQQNRHSQWWVETPETTERQKGLWLGGSHFLSVWIVVEATRLNIGSKVRRKMASVFVWFFSNPLRESNWWHAYYRAYVKAYPELMETELQKKKQAILFGGFCFSSSFSSFLG